MVERSDARKEWLAVRRGEKMPILLVTLGTAYGEKLYRVLAESLVHLDLAVVMVVPFESERKALESCNGARFQVTGFTNLHELVNSVDVVMHQCGHGTLHTVLLGGKPSVTLASGEYHREDNGIRLEELGCGSHLSNEFFRHG